MYFDSLAQIREIASKTGCSIFVVPKNLEVKIDGALFLAPAEKSVITIEQVRNIISRLAVKQTSDIFVLIRPAEALGDEASNALLKNLEEPGDKVHFVLITDSPSQLLPTILSRSVIYFLRTKKSNEIVADEKIKALAKRLIVAKPTELVSLAEELTKKKDGIRGYVLQVLGVAIEMLYKSYFITKKDVFIKKLPRFLMAYENIERNGHIKLHLVADLL